MNNHSLAAADLPMLRLFKAAFVSSSWLPRPNALSSTFTSTSPASSVSRHFLPTRHVARRKTTMTTGRDGSPPAAIEDIPQDPGILRADLRDEMSRSYLEYAMSVILGRAMPDLRDGLKPVHRRILFAMHNMGLSPTAPFRKSARVVGEVLGKYHPHGDTAVYDALVRMAQTFSMSVPLVNGHGNFGSTDGDPAAAMRYTESKLSPIARDAMLTDLDRDTVEFAPTFDASELEPRVLPARFPNLLVNGSSGIAVGMATNIPPHNLREVVMAVEALIRNPSLDDDELANIIPGPDFPTGGQIVGRVGINDMVHTGRGRIILRACVNTEVLGVEGTRRTSRDAIVVTELPYQVNKAVLVAKIAELVNDKKIDGIADLRDESDRDGTRIVIELKRDARVALVLNQLFKRTSLQTSFSANIVALDKGQHPMRLTLREYLTKFISFRQDTVFRRVKYDLKVTGERLHIVEGLVTVQDNLDEVVRLIRAAQDSGTARKELMEQYDLSEKQASSVLDMQLRRLTQLEAQKLHKERNDLMTRKTDLEETLQSPERIDNIILEDLKEVMNKFPSPRRSKILLEDALDSENVDEMLSLSNDKCIMVVTDQGYIKRMAISSFDSQNRGTRGKRGVGRLRVGDKIGHLFTCMTHDSLIAVSCTGVAYLLSAYKVPLSSLGSRGVPIFELLPCIPAGETIASVIPVSNFSDNEYLVLLSHKGFVKKIALSEMNIRNARGKRVIMLGDGDELMTVKRCSEEDSVVISTRGGLVMRFKTNGKELRSTGRISRGVKSIRLGEGDVIADMDVLNVSVEQEGLNGTVDEEDTFLLAVTKNGTGKRVAANQFRCQRRGGRGTRGIRLRTDENGENDKVIAMQNCHATDSVMLVASDGTIVRTKVRMIPVQGRYSHGVRIQRVGDDGTVAAVAVLRGMSGVDDEEDEGGVDDEDEDEEEDGNNDNVGDKGLPGKLSARGEQKEDDGEEEEKDAQR